MLKRLCNVTARIFKIIDIKKLILKEANIYLRNTQNNFINFSAFILYEIKMEFYDTNFITKYFRLLNVGSIYIHILKNIGSKTYSIR